MHACTYFDLQRRIISTKYVMSHSIIFRTPGIDGTTSPKPCLSCITEPCETCHDSSSSLTTILTSVIATVVILLIVGCVVIMVVVYRRKCRRRGHNPLDGTNLIYDGDGEHGGFRNVSLNLYCKSVALLMLIMSPLNVGHHAIKTPYTCIVK